jgi:hypothetical protein
MTTAARRLTTSCLAPPSRCCLAQVGRRLAARRQTDSLLRHRKPRQYSRLDRPGDDRHGRARLPHDRFIADLKAGEVEVYEDGVKQTVVSFVLSHGRRIH